MPARASERLAQRLEPVDALGDASQRFTPEQLDVRLLGRHPLGRGGGAAEVEALVRAFADAVRARSHRGILDPVVVALERHVLLQTQAPDEVNELLGPGIALALVALRVTVGGHVVAAADDVDQEAPATELVKGCRSAGEVGGLPIARTDRDQRLERSGAGGERSGDSERVRAAPPGADQGAGPAVRLGSASEVGGEVEGSPPVLRVVAPMPWLDGVRDVPEKLVAQFRSFASGLLPAYPIYSIGLVAIERLYAAPTACSEPAAVDAPATPPTVRMTPSWA